MIIVGRRKMGEATVKQNCKVWEKIIHFEIEKEGDKFYLCNQAVNTFPEKRTTDKDKVTCLNCLRRLKKSSGGAKG